MIMEKEMRALVVEPAGALTRRLKAKMRVARTSPERLGEAEEPDVLCVDVRMPRRSGLALLRQVRVDLPRTPVLLLVESGKEARPYMEALGHCPSDFVRIGPGEPFDVEEIFFRMSELCRVTPLEETFAPLASFEHVVPRLHDPQSGRLDAARIAEFFALPLAGIARIVGRSLPTLHKTPDAPSLQESLAVFERIAASLIRSKATGITMRSWLGARHPELSDKTPLAVIEEGHAGVVADLLDDTLVGQPG